METTKQAVLLVAGEGKRLRPFTDSNPKCFAPVAGKRILEHALCGLAASGCQDIRIVTGHMAELIQTTITARYAGMTIEYVNNPVYHTTNSMYSLALGLERLHKPTWVIEGDVFFEHSILRLPVTGAVAWFVDSTSRELDGAYVEADAEGRARSLQIVRDLRLLQPNQFKSIGILNLSETGVQRLRQWLRDGIASGQQNLYYDLIIGPHMAESDVHVVDVAGHKWFEIDTNEDLEKAGQLFA